MGKISRRKPGIAVGEFYVHRRLALYFIGDVCIADRDVDIVVAMAVHERCSMGGDLDLECANVFVFQRETMRGFGVDLDFGRYLRSQKWNQQEQKQCAL